MLDIPAITANLSKYRQDIGANFRKVRYGTKVLTVNPSIQHTGLNTAYPATGALRDAVERWKVYLPKQILTASAIAASALEDYDFGAWEIQEGNTWLKVFIEDIAKQQTGRYVVTFARGIVDQNLTVTYTIGGGQFTTDPATGNPVESTTTATFYGKVSQGRNRTQFEQSAGLSPARIYLEGYYSTSGGDPTTIPAGLQLMRRWPAVLDIGGGLTVDGTFLPLVTAEDPWAAQEDKRGTTLQGWFATVGSGR